MIHAPTINERTWFCILKKNSAKSFQIFMKPKMYYCKIDKVYAYMDEIFNA